MEEKHNEMKMEDLLKQINDLKAQNAALADERKKLSEALQTDVQTKIVDGNDPERERMLEKKKEEDEFVKGFLNDFRESVKGEY